MKPERTQVFLHPDRVRFTVNGVTMKPERTQFTVTVNGVVMKPARTRLSICRDAFELKRLQGAFDQFVAAVRFVGFGNFGQAIGAVRSGVAHLRDVANELVQIEIELVPVQDG